MLVDVDYYGDSTTNEKNCSSVHTYCLFVTRGVVMELAQLNELEQLQELEQLTATSRHNLSCAAADVVVDGKSQVNVLMPLPDVPCSTRMK